MVPGLRDNDDVAVELLSEILAELRGSSPGGGNGGDDVTINETVYQGGSGGGAPTAPMDPERYYVVETAGLDDANLDGSITLQPGEQREIVGIEHEGAAPIILYAVGATDRVDVSYRLTYGNDNNLGGWTQSPLGSINNPFSFVQSLGRTIPVDQRVSYVARLSDQAESSVDLAGRVHVEV